jgi:hypothetical protein
LIRRGGISIAAYTPHYKRPPKRPKPERDWYEITTLGTAIVGLVVVAASAGIALWAALIARNAATDSKTAADAAVTQANAAVQANRPWIHVNVALNRVLLERSKGSKSISVDLKFSLKNYGGTPATNIRVNPELAPFIDYTKIAPLLKEQAGLCIQARADADQNPVGGIAVFPGDTGSTAEGVERRAFLFSERHYFSIIGCIDYTYGDNLHGQTGFQIDLGQVAGNRILGVPWTEAHPVDLWHITPAMVASGFPADMVDFEIPVSDLHFAPNETQGNYAK